MGRLTQRRGEGFLSMSIMTLPFLLRFIVRAKSRSEEPINNPNDENSIEYLSCKNYALNQSYKNYNYVIIFRGSYIKMGI